MSRSTRSSGAVRALLASSLMLFLVLPACRSTSETTAGGAAEPAHDVWTGALDEDAFAALHELTGDAAPPRLGGRIDVAPGGGRAPFSAYLSRPAGADGPLPAVILIHEWWGLNEHIEHFADRVAALGYTALAVDLYDGAVATKPDEAMAAMRAVDAEAARAKLLSAFWYVREHPSLRAAEVASLGWCFGGKWSLELAIAAPELDGAVVYYGQVETDPARLRAIGAKVLGVFGTRDASIPAERVDAFERALAEAGVEHEILRYDAEHAFANPSGARYDADNAEAAWKETRAFLARVLGGRR